MIEATAEQIVEAITARVGRNDPETNSTWDSATRVEIAAELGVNPSDVSGEGGDPDGPLGEAISDGLVEAHPRYPTYYRLTGGE